MIVLREAENKQLNPSEIARAVGSVPLRLADVVRYDSDGKRNYYRLKHRGEIRQVLAALSRLVKATSTVPGRHR
jgi:hypothetical protein